MLFVFFFLPISCYDLLLPFFISFPFCYFSLLHFHFSCFCPFSLLLSVWASDVKLRAPHITLKLLAFVTLLCGVPGSNLNLPMGHSDTICVVLCVAAVKFSDSQTGTLWLPSTSFTIHCALIILLLDVSNLRYWSASLNKPEIRRVICCGNVDVWMSQCYSLQFECKHARTHFMNHWELQNWLTPATVWKVTNIN